MIIGNPSPSATLSYAIPVSSGSETVVDVVAVEDVSGAEVEGAGRVDEVEDGATGSAVGGSAAPEQPTSTAERQKYKTIRTASDAMAVRQQSVLAAG